MDKLHLLSCSFGDVYIQKIRRMGPIHDMPPTLMDSPAKVMNNVGCQGMPPPMNTPISMNLLLLLCGSFTWQIAGNHHRCRHVVMLGDGQYSLLSTMIDPRCPTTTGINQLKPLSTTSIAV